MMRQKKHTAPAIVVPVGAIPRGAIAFLVGREHCSTPVAEVRTKIEKRVAKESWATPRLIKACGAYAAKVHAKNVKLYCDVMGGRIGWSR